LRFLGHRLSKVRTFIKKASPGQAIVVFLLIAFGFLVLITLFSIGDVVIILLASVLAPILVKIYLFFML